MTFLPVPDHFHMFYDYFRPFRLFPSISLFQLVSFQISILLVGSDCSESGSLPLIRLHFCSATIPFPVDLCVLLSSDHMTSVSPSNYDPFLIVLFCIYIRQAM